MARLFSCGFEINDNATAAEIDAFSGFFAIDNNAARTGSYGGKSAPTASTGFARAHLFSSDQNKVAYQAVAVRVNTTPNALIQLIRFSTTGNGNVGAIKLNTDGTLLLTNSTGTQIGSASLAINDGKWHVVEMGMDSTTNPGTLSARLDGVQFASGSNDIRGSWGRIVIGCITPNSTASIDFDDWRLNDTTGTQQNSWPGDSKLILRQPNAAGDANAWLNTAGGAGASTDWGLVDENPANDATDYIQTGTLNNEDLFNIANFGLSSVDVINVVHVSGRFRNDTADATAAFKFEIEKAASGTKSQSAAIIPNSTTWKTNNVSALIGSTVPITLYADPDGNPWTSSTLDSIQAGVILTAANVNKVQVSAIWVYVDYTPGPVGKIVKAIQAINRASTY